MIMRVRGDSRFCWVFSLWLVATTSALAIDIPQSAVDESYLQLYNLSLSRVKVNEDYEEVILADGTTVALQRTATDGIDSLRLHEITNGSLIVQLVFSPSQVFVDCDVSNSRQQIHRLTKHFTSKLHKQEKYSEIDLAEGEATGLLDIDGWIGKCTGLHAEKLKRSTVESNINSDSNEAKPSEHEEDSGKAKDELVRPKRGISDLIYPG